MVMHIQIIIWYGKYLSENFKTGATLAFKARGCYCDYYITVECSFLCLLKKKMSHVLTTSKLYYGQFCKVKRILVCLQIEAIKLDETQPVNLNNFLTANLIVVPHDFSKNSKLSPNVKWEKKQNNQISTKYKISIIKFWGKTA